uniref:R-spondin 4 n=1 Tax=Zosterops lateralis melanops TaxID=1220523 RepID=A0A8D2QKQ1_ZOSLA
KSFPTQTILGFYGSIEPRSQASSASLLENCTGCVLCSEDNGCITCHHRLFLLIWRDGIRQYGMCVHTCPPGYFGVRGLEVNRCTKCRSPSCESCFSRDFCMKCKDKFYLYKGQCFRQCPPGTAAQPGTRECQGKQRWGLPGSRISPPFTQQTRCRVCPGGACTGAGLAMGTRTWLMSFLDKGIWTEATLINLHLVTGRKGDA